MPRPDRTPTGDLTDRPSKSQRKRDSLALQDLGESLVTLSDERLRSLALPERLVDAIQLVRTIRAHEGRRRQMQFIGRLMREEADVEAIRRALEDEHHQHRVDTALMHEAERWRDQLLTDPAAVERWLVRAPDSRAHLDTALASARSEWAVGVRGRHYRELFRFIRASLAEPHGDRSPPSKAEPLGERPV
jgi:ribosome-associated protein